MELYKLKDILTYALIRLNRLESLLVAYKGILKNDKEIEMNETIFATPNENGKYTLTNSKGEEAQEGFEYDTKTEALEAATMLWPTNSVWEGKKVRNGWRIKID